MQIARWLILLAGLAACGSAALYLITRNALFWVIAKRISLAMALAGVVFFGVLIAERLGFM